MADVIIKGVEMPDGCHNCGFSYFDKGKTNGGELCTVLMCSIMSQGTIGAEYDGKRPFWCPLVPLPEGHGRLIDADALKHELMASGIIIHYGTQINLKIDNAPTIVPAEGGSDNG